MQRLAIMAASLIGLACCILAVQAMRAQQAEDLAAARPVPAVSTNPLETHHIRASLSRASVAPARIQHLDGTRRIFG